MAGYVRVAVYIIVEVYMIILKLTIAHVKDVYM